MKKEDEEKKETTTSSNNLFIQSEESHTTGCQTEFDIDDSGAEFHAD